MLKSLANALLIIFSLNAIFLVLGLTWLYGSNRIDGERFRATLDLYRLSIDQEQYEIEKAQDLAEQTRQAAIEAARLEEAADGPITLTERLAADQEADEVARLRLERFQREIADLRRRMDNDKLLLAKEKEEIQQQREALEQRVKELEEKQASEDFQKALGMIEALKPKQAKAHFQYMMQQGQLTDAVDYLAAMQPRKAGAALREFKEPMEVAQRAELVQQLRQRGVDLLEQVAADLSVAEPNP